jgi:hypothetical protein
MKASAEHAAHRGSGEDAALEEVGSVSERELAHAAIEFPPFVLNYKSLVWRGVVFGF